MAHNILIKLFIVFFHTGLFSFGGGYATLPFLYDISENYHWYSLSQLNSIIAISSITPGPIGINMATFAGFSTYGIQGSLIATIAVVIPSLIIVVSISKIINKFKKNLFINNIVKTLKPAGCALLSATGIKLLLSSNLHIVGIIGLGMFIIISFTKKMEPLFYLSCGAIFGIIAGFLNLIES